MDLGFPIGLEADIAPFLDSRSMRFEPGDVLVLYTDGITEAEDRSGRFFKIESLCESAQRWRGGSAAEIKAGIVRDVMAHVDSQPLLDDITLVVVKHR
jgi:sigma-B regulation protein RsbU (phosphoserine phosphatase)